MRLRSWHYTAAAWAALGVAGCSSAPKPGVPNAALGQAGPADVSPIAKMTAAVGAGAKSAVAWATPKPKPKPEIDATSLAKKPGKLGPDIYVQLAKVHESKGNAAAAESQYAKALEVDPNDLAALLGYAHLLDRQNKLAEATVKYETAARLHPKSATAQNDLGLCYARRGMFDQSLAALQRAVALDEKKVLYRNNLATVLVETGRTQDALTQLAAVHDAATAHYNVGILLHQKNQLASAAVHFAEAARLNPNMNSAREWLAKLQPQTPPTYADTPPSAPTVARPVSATTEIPTTLSRSHAAPTGPDRYDETPPEPPRRQPSAAPIRLPASNVRYESYESAPLPADRR